MIKLRLLFVGLFVLGSTYFLVKESTSTPRILVLQSYGSDYSWTHDVDIGIKKILEKEKFDFFKLIYSRNNLKKKLKKLKSCIAFCKT